MARSSRSFALVVALAALPKSALAQHAGFPVHLSPAHSRVVGGYLDLGSSGGSVDAAGLSRLGARLRWTTPRWQLVAGGGRVSSKDAAFDAGPSLGGTVAYSFAQRGRRRVGLFAGAGWAKLNGASGTSLQRIDLPIGAAAALYAPPPFGVVELWGAPRIHVRSTRLESAAGRERTTQVGPGASAGLSYTHSSSQLGVGISADAVMLDTPGDGGWKVVGSFGVSLHYLRIRR